MPSGVRAPGVHALGRIAIAIVMLLALSACRQSATGVAEPAIDAGAFDGGGPGDVGSGDVAPGDVAPGASGPVDATASGSSGDQAAITAGPTGIGGGPAGAPARLSGASSGVPATGSPARRAAGSIQLTEPGCCTAPSWTSDGQRVVFMDRRDDRTAIFGVHIDRPGQVEEVLPEVAAYTAGLDYRIDPMPDGTRLTRLADGDVWDLPTGGRPVVVSPDGEAAAWSEFNRDAPPENRRTKLRVMRRGGEPATIAELGRGSLSGWLGADHLLASRRPDSSNEIDELIVVDLVGGGQRRLLSTERLRGVAISPGGNRIAAHATGKGQLKGLFIAEVASGAITPVPDALFGAYRWRDADRLLIIPMQPGANHRLVEFDAGTGATRDLIPAEAYPFKVAGGDWSVAPGGARIAWVAAGDKSLWIRELPE